MGEWIQIVKCPHCEETKEVSITQNRWKCHSCGMKWGVKSTLWRSVKNGR